MKKGKKIRVVIINALLIATLIQPCAVLANQVTEETSLAGMSALLDDWYKKEEESDVITSLFNSSITIPKKIAICKCNDSVNIRQNAGVKYNIIGQLPKDAACVLLEEPKDGFVKMKSGDVTGYISTDYLYMGQEGIEKARELATLTATVTADSVNVRKTPSTLTDDNIITVVNRKEDLDVIEENCIEVVTKNDPNATSWIQVEIDDMTGYVSKEFVDVSYKWKSAEKMEAVTSSTLRMIVINETKKYLGLRYVWGGTSLKTGADCSGFVVAIYNKCGVSASKIGLPRTSSQMAKHGKRVTFSNIQPGDLVFYGDSAGNVNHVGIYLGNGKVIHESGRKYGCKISNINYRTVLAIRNYLD